MYVGRFLVPMQVRRHDVLLPERVGEVFHIVGAPLVQTSLPFDAFHVLVRSRHVDADRPYLVASDFTCQPRFFQSSLNSRRTVFHPVGVFDEPAVQVRACGVGVLRNDETFDMCGCSAVAAMRLFHVQYYETHIYSFLFQLVKQ